MMKTDLNNKIITYLSKYHPNRIGIFGSYARNEKTPNDIDILVDLKDTLTLLQLVKIERELAKILGMKVDIVTKNSLKNKKLKKYIEEDLQIIYR